MVYFDHEKLNVYQLSLKFVAWLENILPKIDKTLSVRNQIERSSTSIPLNIAEGNGKFTVNDRCKFFDIARGSALESASCLDVLFIKKKLSEEEIDYGKSILKDIVSMLIGLIKSNSDRLHEPETKYKINKE
ncbi:MAG: four helix bundle protein [Ignavibacteria bacterium CG_4_8_14_3_um_filter_37_9]|nr:MAG: four helix bundle protein [Ignavibacteria bacterium CG_4_8_14_3_um_filter_37_9]